MITTATDIQNNFGKYLGFVISGNEVIITKNGREVARLIPKDYAMTYLTDSLTGVLKDDYDVNELKAESLKNKYGFTH